jgi:hypothetical protein
MGHFGITAHIKANFPRLSPGRIGSFVTVMHWISEPERVARCSTKPGANCKGSIEVTFKWCPQLCELVALFGLVVIDAQVHDCLRPNGEDAYLAAFHPGSSFVLNGGAGMEWLSGGYWSIPLCTPQVQKIA